MNIIRPKHPLRWLYVFAVAALLSVLLAHWAYDDPFITYRYAHNLGNGLGFVYNPGERVLSTTTPLLALLLAPFAAIGFDLHVLANLIGALSLAVGGLLLWDLARTWQTPWVGWAGLLIYPFFPLVLSTMSSETPLYLALCLAAFAGYARRRYTLTALACALAGLARPDALLVPAILAAHSLITNLSILRSSNFNRAAFQPAFIFAAILLAWAIFAWAYFGSPIPVTLAAKQSQGAMEISQKFHVGLLTIVRYYTAWPYLLEAGLAVVGLALLAWKKRTWLLFIAWPVSYFVAYTLLGVSRYFWYYAPLVPGFVVLVGLGLEGVAGGKGQVAGGKGQGEDQRASPAPFNLSTFNFLAAILLILLGAVHIRNLFNLPQHIDRRYAIYRAAGEWLAQNTPPEASVGTLEVGILGYYARRPVVDFAGLIQPEVARQMGAASTYEDTALWAAERYHPDYVVLFPGSLARFEQAYVAVRCQPAQTFLASDYNGPGDLIIYHCNP
jgi:hypothetical protein